MNLDSPFTTTPRASTSKNALLNPPGKENRKPKKVKKQTKGVNGEMWRDDEQRAKRAAEKRRGRKRIADYLEAYPLNTSDLSKCGLCGTVLKSKSLGQLLQHEGSGMCKKTAQKKLAKSIEAEATALVLTMQHQPTDRSIRYQPGLINYNTSI
ncbi:hypothetical protein GALMADRAFT_229528 [Galerina marginata CBS 339.88]|uniref:Uncharacterized protein n=1 Tax=Galerina marginata (strain CBS 339.88) TaxID=685588 RepID=A0A067SKU4_GALM3|nr:hypothetical protein GALMADRAFT_229528 [Galerina marginata CBS 339.88]